MHRLMRTSLNLRKFSRLFNDWLNVQHFVKMNKGNIRHSMSLIEIRMKQADLQPRGIYSYRRIGKSGVFEQIGSSDDYLKTLPGPSGIESNDEKQLNNQLKVVIFWAIEYSLYLGQIQ